MIKGLIFDKDGTLFDFNATWGAWTRSMLEAETAKTPHQFAPLAEAMGYDTATNQFRPDSVVIAATAGETAECIRSVLPELDFDALLERMNAAAARVAQVEVVPLIGYFKALKARGFKFCGPTIVYAWLEATGVVNDHLTGCFRHDEVAKMAR